MFAAIDCSQLNEIVGGVSPEHAVSCIGSYMGTTPDGSRGELGAQARTQNFLQRIQSPNRKTSDRARGGFSGMNAAMADHASGIHGEDMALRRCGARTAF